MSLISRLKKIAGLIDKSLHQVSVSGKLVGEVVLGGMVSLIVVDVILRYLFNQPLAYSLEVVELALSVVVFFGIVLCTARQGHIDINILVMRFSPRVQASINSFVYFLSTGIFALITWRLFVQGINLQQMGTVSHMLKIPQYLFVLVFALCSVLVTLLFLSQLIHFVGKAVSK